MHTQLLETVSSIIPLEEQEKLFITSVFKEKTARKNEYFLQEGQVCREVGFIIQGLIRYYSNNDGEDLIYDFGKEGSFFCNYESFLDHSPSKRNIQFIEDTTYLSISFTDLQLFYEQVKEGQKFGRIICEQIFVDAIKKVTSLYTDQPEQRYLQFTQSYPDLQQRIPQYYIASFVGIKPQSLSRIRKRLTDS